MKWTAIANKLDDLLNPIAVKELRQAVKSRIVVSALMLSLLVQLSVLLFTLSFSASHALVSSNLYAGREIFLILQGILLGTCMLLVPSYAGVRLAAEHSDTNVDLLFISTLRPRSIIAGKLQASVILILLIFSACAPFMTFTYLLRGIDIPSIVLILALDFLAVLLAAQGAIFLGAVPANMGLKLLLGLVGLSLLLELFGSAMGCSIALLEGGLETSLDSVEFWFIAGAVVLAVVATVGLLFTWAVAIVSPPSANRALPVRLYLLGFWLVTGGATIGLAHYFRTPIPLWCWQWMMLTLLGAQLLVSINEREQWGLRVRRTISRRGWLRGPLFLLYSGSAGGILFTLLLSVLTIALPSLALEYGSAFFTPLPSSSVLYSFPALYDFNHHNTYALVLIALYAFDYCLLAVWLRTVLLRGRVKAAHTWVLVLLLGGLGTSLPWPLLFLFQNEELRRGHIDPWWQISNPFSTIYTCVAETGGDTEAFRTLALMFLGSLTLILFLGCLPWMIRQLRHFRPPEKEISG